MAEFGTLPLRCTRRKPSGFSDPSHYKYECTVIAFVFGRHEDAVGFNRAGEAVLAVYLTEDGIIRTAPAYEFVAHGIQERRP